MKRFVISILILSVIGTTGCVSENTPKTSESEQIIRAVFEAFNRHDSSALSEFYASDARVHSPETCEPTIGPKAIAENYQALFDQIPDVTDTISEMITEGNKVAVSFIASSSAQGAEFELPIAAIFTLKNGLIIEDVAYFDTGNTPHC